jgi:hypothetical protein
MTPVAHASAARSALKRSLKLINAHLIGYARRCVRNPPIAYINVFASMAAYLFFSTYTIDLTAAGGIEGMEERRYVRSDCSVVDAGNGDIKRDVWDAKHESSRCLQVIEIITHY